MMKFLSYLILLILCYINLFNIYKTLLKLILGCIDQDLVPPDDYCDLRVAKTESLKGHTGPACPHK